LFALDPATGLLKFVTAPNFENPAHGNVYNIKIQATDSGNASIVKDVVVTVTNVDEAPLITSAAVMSIAETHAVAAPALTVGAIAASDPEGGSVTLSLVDSADGRFALSGNQLVVANPALLDFEDPTNPGHVWSVVVQASDAAGHVVLQTINVQITNGLAAENVVGGATTGNNSMNGTAGADIINGLAGQDTMTGLGGNDTYFVDNTGDKVVEAGNGGNDRIYTTLAKFDMNSAANVETLIFNGNGAFQGTAASNAASTIIGGGGDDRLSGGNQADTLIGGAGNDALTGGSGDDRLFGDAGADTINGGNGADRITGGTGADSLTGGLGNDTFYFGAGFGQDVITDFSVANDNHDILELSRALFASVDDVLAHSATVGANVVITAGADTITLQKVTILNAFDIHLI
ncbi:MAG: Cadherin, partial [Hyphomicrobiales bacterium]|nr:Cadherin [Hyphomicrobiales bacterium]